MFPCMKWKWRSVQQLHMSKKPNVEGEMQKNRFSNLTFCMCNKEEASPSSIFLYFCSSSSSVSPPSLLLPSSSHPPPPICRPLTPSCGIMGIVQVAWRSTLCPRRSRRRRAVMTCSTARSPSSPSQLIPALRSSVAAAVGAMWVWAPSLELLVMCLAAAPILPLLPFHRRRRRRCCYTTRVF